MNLIEEMASGVLTPLDVRKVLYKKSLHDFGRAAFPHVQGAKFVEGHHTRILARHLEAVAKKDDPIGRITRLLANLPPSVGKSYFISQIFVPWVWTWWPECRFLYFSYVLPRGTKDSVLCRNLIKSKWYQQHFNDSYQIESGEDTKTFYRNTAGGWRMTSYPGGPALGEHPDIIIIDDPITIQDVAVFDKREAQKSWYFEQLSTRGAAREVAHVISQQRLHVEDLSGHVKDFHKKLIEAGQESPWHNLCLPMRYDPEIAMEDRGYGGEWRTKPGELIYPQLLDEKTVSGMERTLSMQGPWAVQAQFGQKPTRRDGEFFKMSRVQELPSKEFPRVFDRVVRFWDLAATEDAGCNTAGPAVGVIVPKGQDVSLGKFYALDMEVGQWSGDEVESRMEDTAKRDEISFGYENVNKQKAITTRFEREPGSSGKRVAELLERKLLRWNVKFVEPVGDKETRAGPLATIIAEGRFYVPSDAPWVPPMIAEMQEFPGKLKDRVDGLSGAVMELLFPKRAIKVLVSSGGGERKLPRGGQMCPHCDRPKEVDAEICCDGCESGQHTPHCNLRYSNWYVKQMD